MMHASSPKRIRPKIAAMLRIMLPAIAAPALVDGSATALMAAEASLPPRPAERSTTPPQFRRIFVPSDRIGDVTSSNLRFLPVPRDEFGRLIDVGDPADAKSTAWIEHAEFRADVRGSRLEMGSARIEVEHVGDAPAWLEVQFAGLAPERLRWADERPLAAGTYPTEGRKGNKRGVVVDRTGEIRFAWTAVGRQKGNGNEFRLALPAATTIDVVLVAPPAIKLAVDNASIRSVRRNESGAVEYQIAVRGGEPFVVKTTAVSGQAFTALSTHRHRTSYHVLPSEVRIDSQLRIIPLDQSLNQLELRCPPYVEVVDVVLGGQLLPFSEAPLEGHDQKRIRVTLPQALPSGETEVRVRALMTTRFGGTMALPLLRVSRSTWLGGRVQLTVGDALQVHDLIREGFQPISADLPANPGSSQWAFEQAAPYGALALAVGRSPKRLLAQLFTSAEVARDEILAETTADLSSDEGVESIFQAEMPSGWQITSVESQPAGMVRSWDLQMDNASQGKGAAAVSVVLEQPLEPLKDVRLRFKSRFQRRRGGADLTARQLVPLRFPHLAMESHWIELVPTASLAFSPGEFQLVPAAEEMDVPNNLRGLLSGRRDALLLAAHRNAEPISLETSVRAAEMTADVHVEVKVTDSLLRHRYRISVEPQAGEVAQLGVLFSERVAATPEWRFIDSTGKDIAAEHVASESDDDVARPQNTRTMRWQLARAQMEPFELLISMDQAWEESAVPLVLAGVESTSSQSGTVEIAADRSIRPAVENRSLDPIPTIPEAESREPFQQLAAYRFNPERVAAGDGDPLIIRRMAPKQLVPEAWIRNAELDSVYLPTGKIVHDLILSLQSRGLEQLHVSLPAAERILYRTEGSAWRRVSLNSAGGDVAIPLPGNAGRYSLEMRFWETRNPLGAVESIRPSPISFSVPVGRFAYRPWLPQGYYAVDLPRPDQRLLAAFQLLNGTTGRAGTSRSAGILEADVPHLPLSRGSVAPFHVVHAATVRLWCMACLALGGSLGIFLGRMRRRWALAAAAVGFAVALWIPAAYAPLASAIAWGCMGGALLLALLPRLAILSSRLMQSQQPSGEVATTSAVLLVWLVLSAGGASAQPASRTDPPLPIPSVIDPIDEKREPVGPNVFVPESLYSALLDRERHSRAPLGQWLITRCRVRGSLVQGSGTSTLQPQGWNMLIEVSTFHRDAEVRLPLPRDAAQWRTESIRVDGAKTPTRWSSDGALLYVPIAEPGSHHVELAVRPRLRQQDVLDELSLPLPATAECSVELSVPQNVSGITFPNSPGAIDYRASTSTYRGFVGPTDELIVSWPAGPFSTSDAAIETLSWLHVGRTATLIEQRLVIDALGDHPVHFDVVPQSGVRYLPSAMDLPYVRIRAGHEPRARLSITVRAPETETVVVPLQFVAEHASTASTIPVPRIAIERGPDTTSKWTAVQNAAGVRVDPLPGMGVEAIEPRDFLDRWGSTDNLPDFAYREQPGAPVWRMAIEPVDARVESAESILVVAHLRGLTTDYRADCLAGPGGALVQRLKVPGCFVTRRVDVTQDGRDLGASWTQSDDGALRVVLRQPVTGRYRLSVEGEIPVDESGRTQIPLLNLEAEKRAATRLTVARTPGTVLEIEPTDVLHPVSNASLPADWQEEWYLCGQFTVSSPTGLPSIADASVSRAEFPGDARTVVAVSPSLRGWEVDVHFRLSGAENPVDQLVYVASKDWHGPFEVEPSDRWKILVHEESTYNRVILRPRVPPGDQVQVTVRGQALEDRQDILTVPAVRLLEPAVPNNLIALPRKMSGQPTVWDTQNLLRIDGAPGIERLIGNSDGWLLYRKTAEPATARPRVVEQDPSAPMISLVESRASIGRGDAYLETTLTLDPRGRRSCEIRLEQQHELLDVRVNGRRVAPWQIATHRWRMQLASSQLPQLITIHCRQRDINQGSSVQLDAPVLLADGREVSVLQTAWHVASEQRWHSAGARPSEVKAVSDSMLAAVRLANLIESLDEIVPALLGGSAANWVPWLEYWRGRIAEAEARYSDRVASEADEAAAQAFDAAQQRLARLEEALPHTPQPAESANVDSSGSDVPSDWAGLERRRAGEWDASWLSPGRLDSMQLQRLTPRNDFGIQRMLGAAMLAMIVGGTIWFSRGSDSFKTPFASGIAIGLVHLLAFFVLLSSQLWAIIVVAAVAVAWIVYLATAQRRRPYREHRVA